MRLLTNRFWRGTADTPTPQRTVSGHSRTTAFDQWRSHAASVVKNDLKHPCPMNSGPTHDFLFLSHSQQNRKLSEERRGRAQCRREGEERYQTMVRRHSPSPMSESPQDDTKCRRSRIQPRLYLLPVRRPNSKARDSDRLAS